MTSCTSSEAHRLTVKSETWQSHLFKSSQFDKMIDSLLTANATASGNKKGQNKSKKRVLIVELLEILSYCTLAINAYE